MIDRLNSDRSIRPYVVQFVPLKVETQGEVWSRWVSKYPFQGSSIPIIYIIRADGEMLYGQSGALDGDSLTQLMVGVMPKAGRVFNDKEYALLKQSVDAARAAVADKQFDEAVKQLSSLAKLGTLGELGSYAKLAREADEMATELTARGKEQLAAAQGKLADKEAAFDGALLLAETVRVFGRWTPLKDDLTAVARDVKKDEALAELFAQAQDYDRAMVYCAMPTGRSRAESTLRMVVQRYPDSPVAQRAQKKLEELGASPEPTSPGAAATASRSSAVGAPPAKEDLKKAASYLRMARVFAENSPEKAIEYAQKAIDVAPGSSEADEARTLLESLR